MKVFKFLPSCAALLALIACSSDGKDVESPVSEESIYQAPAVDIKDGSLSLSRAETSVADAAEKCAVNILGKLADQTPGDNVLFSPASTWMGLSLLANATGGNTFAQLSDAMGCGDMDIDVINDYNYKLSASLPLLDKNVDVIFANSFFRKIKMTIYESFKSRMHGAYGAEMFHLSSSGNDSAERINSWVKDFTGSKIKNLVNQEEIQDIDFAFLNAVNFEAAWRTIFTTDPTENMKFSNSDGSVAEAQMISSFPDIFGYGVIDGIEIVDIPFGSGAFSLTIALPIDRTASPTSALAPFVSHGVGGIYDHIEESVMRVQLPAFKAESESYMTEVLKGMGVTDLFIENKADFSKMSGDPCFISLFKGKTMFEINEKGANGASSTIAGGLAYLDFDNKEPMEIPVFEADHPFVYLVRENHSNTIIFMGILNRL